MKVIRLAALVLAFGLAGCNDGNPIVTQSQEFPSPDGAYIATLELVDNGLGFGQGALYDEVHVRHRGESIGEHGDPGGSVVFYAESTYQGNSDISLTWLDGRHLRVEFERRQRPGRALKALSGVAIEFLPRRLE